MTKAGSTQPDVPGKPPRSGKFRRARIRRFLFTVGPDRVSGGRISRRHLAQPVAVREIEIVTPRWHRGFDGLRIGHVSDFHLGTLLPLERALEIVDLLADQEPDLIACTGDVVDLEHGEAQVLLDALGRVECPLGCFLVLGNHDELHDVDHLVALAERAGIIVLRNDVVCITHNGQSLAVAGIEWGRTALTCARHLDRSGAGAADLLLAHNPRAFVRAADLGIPLTLAGHTHGGQIAMKRHPNRNLALSQRHSAGIFGSGQSVLYVTTGVGAWFPLRVNCPAEIAMLTVRCAPSDVTDPQP